MNNIIAVASGKGGVGKSTLSVNLAATLANKDLDGTGPKKVALVDLDFYGPSIPILMGGGNISVDKDEKLLPALAHNLKYISIGFFLKNPDDPIIWRGPMFSKAVNQFFTDVNWGEIDVCIVDMPPGTGDAQLSLAQQVSLNSAVVVTTPQEVSVSDVRRAINMFKQVNVPVNGIIENMAGFAAPDGEVHQIFGQGGGEQLAKDFELDFIGSVPISTNIRSSSDAGVPFSINPDYQDSNDVKLIDGFAKKILENSVKLRENKIEVELAV